MPSFVWHPDYEIDIGRHVFPTEKFRLYRDMAVAQGLVREEDIELPPMATDAELLTVLDPEYLADLRGHAHTHRTIRSELPISAGIVEGCVRTAGGTILAARRALDRGAAIHFGGGFHHGFADHAEGFCYINDVAVAAAVAIERGWCSRVAVIDTDVHQGNGTARIFRNEPRVFTMSIHQDLLYPPKEKSDLDAGCHESIGDDAYCALLEDAVAKVVAFGPGLAIVVAGVDPYEGDKLGNLGLTFAGMERRERLTLGPLVRAGIPFVTVTGGGYARDLNDTIALHAQTARVAVELARA